MINDNTQRLPIDSVVSFIEKIENEYKMTYFINHSINSGVVNKLIDFYGKKMDKDMADGIFDTEHLKMFQIMVNVRDGVIIR